MDDDDEYFALLLPPLSYSLLKEVHKSNCLVGEE